MPWWDARAAEMAEQFPDVSWDKQHIDILSARFVLSPDRFDVVVATNLFGDILSDLGPACTGTIGIAPSANMNPERTFPSLFEPVHGSAPDIAGKGLANPSAMILSVAMMLEMSLGEASLAKKLAESVECVLKEGHRTKDLTSDNGAYIKTSEFGENVEHAFRKPLDSLGLLEGF
jgi:tartrate dehydrogenase/decarboxylase/D-malate dehydrogenase